MLAHVAAVAYVSGRTRDGIEAKVQAVVQVVSGAGPAMGFVVGRAIMQPVGLRVLCRLCGAVVSMALWLFVAVENLWAYRIPTFCDVILIESKATTKFCPSMVASLSPTSIPFMSVSTCM